MSNKNGLVRMKVEFENTPLMDTRQHIRSEQDFDDMVGNLKLKLFGR